MDLEQQHLPSLFGAESELPGVGFDAQSAPRPLGNVLMGVPDLQGGAQDIWTVQQNRELLAAQMRLDPRTSHLTLVDNSGGCDSLTLAILQSFNPAAPAHELSAQAQQYRHILLNSHPEHFQFGDENGQVSLNANAYLDINAPDVLDTLLGAVFGQNRPQVNLIYPHAEGGLLMHTVGQANPQLGSITLADLGGHYMAAVPMQTLRPSMPLANRLDSSNKWEALGSTVSSENIGTCPGFGISGTGSSLIGDAPSTVSYLAAQFSAADLLSATIQQRNFQDFSGEPLSSGHSIDSHALSSSAYTGIDGATPAQVGPASDTNSATKKRPAIDESINTRPSRRQRLKPLPQELVPVADAHPRLPEEAKKDSAYARRLHELSQQGVATARVGAQPLSVAQLALLSGATEGNLNQDPKLKPLPQELVPVGDAHPRLPEEAKKDSAYARRLHELSQQGVATARVGGQPLSVAQLALLSGAKEGNLNQDPKLKPLPQELVPVANAHPRLPEEAKNGLTYARRLHELSQQGVATARVGGQPLSVAQLALLSGAKEGNLNHDPKLKPLPQELVPVANAHPRLPEEAKNDSAYARRLHELSQQGVATARVGGQPLSVAQLALLSGATEGNLNQDPKLKPLPQELVTVANTHPRLPEEAKNDSAYARRLHELSQQGVATARVGAQPLSVAQLALLSGAKEGTLNQDPKLKPLPQELVPVADAHPRLPEEAKKDSAYARRLHELSQQGVATARVGGQPLSVAQLALLSGATVGTLNQAPKLRPLPQELVPVDDAHPRLPEEAKKDSAYARRLHELSQQGVATARVGGQPLSVAQLALLSGAKEGTLNHDPKLKPLPQELVPVANTHPRLPEEAKKDSAYARRLHELSQQGVATARVGGQPLSVAQLALLSGATEGNLNQDPKLKPLPQELVPVANTHPRLPEEAKNDSAYARRLHELSQQGVATARVGAQPLSVAQLALLSGAKEGKLRKRL